MNPKETSIYNQKYHAEHVEEIHARKKKEYSEKRDIILARLEKYRRENPEAVKTTLKKYRVKNRQNHTNYCRMRNGWTVERFSASLSEQHGCCAICKQPMDRPEADHKHTKPPKPRGILCHHCNCILGYAKDSPELCRAAAEYLEAWKTV